MILPSSVSTTFVFVSDFSSVLMLVSLSPSSSVVDVGKLIVPWSSRMASPEGVWRIAGRGLLTVIGLLGGWSGIEGMVSDCLSGCLV